MTASCGRSSDDWNSGGPVRYCVDSTGRRVADAECGRSAMAGGVNPFLWYYLGSMSG